MNIILMGAPGSGKGTQARKLVEKFNLFYLETGDLSREWAEKDIQIKEIVESGGLIPEEKMSRYVFEYLEARLKTFNNILFEGFPRYLSQYTFLENYLLNKKSTIDFIIYLHMTDEEIIKRLSTRRTCRKCDRVYNLITNKPPETTRCVCGGELFQREDDNPKSLEVRLEMFKKNSLPIINYVKNNEKFIQIDGIQSVEIVFQNILERMGAK